MMRSLLLPAIGALGLLTIGIEGAPAQGYGYQAPAIERRVYREYDAPPRVERRVIERRFVEPGPRRRTVCRTVIRERVTPGGVIIRRPTEVCRTIVGGRRVFVD